MHIAMFVVSFYINTKNVVGKIHGPEEDNLNFSKLKKVFTVVTWGHLVSALLQILSFWLKS